MTKYFDSIANHYDSPDRQALAKIIREELTTYLPRDSHQKSCWITEAELGLLVYRLRKDSKN